MYNTKQLIPYNIIYNIIFYYGRHPIVLQYQVDPFPWKTCGLSVIPGTVPVQCSIDILWS
jgi:hypothetical protein